MGAANDYEFGARIRTIREGRGLSGKELADAVGMEPSAISRIETGQQQVRTRDLAKIAQALSVSPLAIIDGDSLLARLPVAARSGDDKPVRSTAYQRILALAELHEVLNKAGITIRPQSPLRPPSVDASAWLSSAETLARWVTDLSFDDTLEAEDRFAAVADWIETTLHVDVLVERHDDGGLIGASITDPDFPIIFVNARESSPRALFTLVHELGHVVASDGAVMALDRDLRGGVPREKFANAFAATLLMPEHEVRRLIDEHGRDASSIAHMIRRFGVSYESLVYRLHNLRIIDAVGRDRLLASGWGGLLRNVDDETLASSVLAFRETTPEHRPPRWLTLRTYRAYIAGEVSVRPLAGLLNVDEALLLAALHPQADSSLDPFDDDLSPANEHESDDLLFSGDPI